MGYVRNEYSDEAVRGSRVLLIARGVKAVRHILTAVPIVFPVPPMM